MSDIFLSHSSEDNQVAAELRERLGDLGHRSVFLDFDPANGIPAGRDWERELYQQLRSCRAVIVLCSDGSMKSRWCFAEITHAKSMGKHVFPVRIEPCEIDPVLTSRQILDLTADKEEALERLWRGLKIAGLDPADAFDWDGSRPPYPGLLAFQEKDAAIFFGRDPEIQQGLEKLQRLHQFGGARMIMVLGGSGSGKSSLVRAGLVPRLRRNPNWLVVDPFRPQERPLQELAIVLSKAFSRHGAERDWREIRDALEAAADADPPNTEPLEDLIMDLLIAADRREATVLLLLDQTEELLGYSTETRAARFLPFFRAALEGSQSRIMAIGTLRSDFLGDFQQHPAVRDLAFDDLRVGPMSKDRLASVIEGPARLAGIDLGPGLTEAMLADTETDDALPLLAFTLRELYERYGEDKHLKLEEYRDNLGGLSGAVAKAVDGVLAAAPLTEEQEDDLRSAFLTMVRINEDGQFARRPARWSEMPESVHGILERFIQARLLTSRGEEGTRMVEVAHEALFRAWDRLRAWLDEDREFLLWRKRLADSHREWERTERDPTALLAGPALAEARGWLSRQEARLDAEETGFIRASLDLEARRRRRRVLLALGTMAFLAIVAIVVFTLWRRAESQRKQAETALLFSFYMSDQLKDVEKPYLLENLGRDLREFTKERTDPVSRRVAAKGTFFEGLASLDRADTGDADEAVRGLMRFEIYREIAAANGWLRDMGAAHQAAGDALEVLARASSSAKVAASASKKFHRLLDSDQEDFRRALGPYAEHFVRDGGIADPAVFRKLRDEQYRKAVAQFEPRLAERASEESVLDVAGLEARLGDAAVDERPAAALAAYSRAHDLIEKHRSLNPRRMRVESLAVSGRIARLLEMHPDLDPPDGYRWEAAFANDFLKASQGPKAEAYLALLANEVNYLGNEGWGHDRIREDKERYVFARWPELHYNLIGDVQLEEKDGLSTLTFPLQYDAHNRERGDTKTGTVTWSLDVRTINGKRKVVVTRETGFVRE